MSATSPATSASISSKKDSYPLPEVEVLLLCSRAGLNAEQTTRVQDLLSQNLDWDYLIQLADRHGLQPLLHWHLNAIDSGAIPSAQRQLLRVAFQRVSALNILLTHELQKLLTLFADNNVQAVPYKGPVLALQLYGDVALRQFSDLDVLVHPRDLLRARDLLLAEEYAPFPPLTDQQTAVLLRTQCNLPFTRERNRMVVELHWTVSAPNFARPFATDDFWSRLVNGKLEAMDVKLLAPEDLLLALCIHGSKHLWERLAWICDIAGLIASQPALDWKSVIDRATATGSERMLFLGLRLAVDLLNAQLPAAVKSQLDSDSTVPLLAQDVIRNLFAKSLIPTGLFGYFRFQLKARRRLRDKFNYLRFAFTPTEEDLVLLKLPRAFTFVYYLVRPFRMAVGVPNHFNQAKKLSPNSLLSPR